MTRVAADLAVDVEVFHQLLAQGDLVIGLFISHIVNFLFRPNETLRLNMALKTPPHVQSGVLVNKSHLINATMALCATDAFVDVGGVVEVNEAGQIVDFDPAYGFIGAPAFANWFKNGGVGP